MFRDDAPECGGIRGANWFSLENNGRIAVNQRPIANVGMSHYPTHVGGGPKDISWIHIIDILHGPIERHQMTCSWPHDALRSASGAGGV